MAHHALVFGASGILGWGVVDQILKNYPEKGVFNKVTALSNRPLTQDNAFWPSAGPGLPDLHVVDGIDLTIGTEKGLIDTFKKRIPEIKTVTQVYYFAYAFNPDFPTESEINLGMLQRGLSAVEALAPNLEYVIFPTGTKKYGIHLPQKPFEAPFTEEMADVPQPWHDQLFYYVLHRELDRMQQGKKWKFAEVTCGPVVGFVPHKNAYNIPAIWMNYLSLYKFMHEKGHPDAASKDVPFPSPPGTYHVVFNDGGQDIFARFSIYLCLHPDAAGNSELYNIADEAKPASMAERWPYMCSLYGLVGVPPVPETDPAFRRCVTWVNEHSDQVEKLAKEKGVELQGVGIDTGLERFMEWINFNHDVSLNKARAVGFREEQSFQEVWKTVFDRYVKAKRAYLGA